MLFGIEKDVANEVRAWSKHSLEKSNPNFNNLAACPYARKAWQEDKIGFVFKYDGHKQDLYTAMSCFDDSKELVILVDFAPEEDPDDFQEYLDLMNDAIAQGAFIQKDLWLMGFHPMDESNDAIDEGSFEATVEEPYALIFIQRLSKLQQSADKLKEKGYYQAYSDDFNVSELYSKREDFYRRLEHGNEAP